MPTNYIVHKKSDINEAVQRGELGDLVTYSGHPSSDSEIYLIEQIREKKGKFQIGDMNIFTEYSDEYNIENYDAVIFSSPTHSNKKRKYNSSSNRSSSRSSSRGPKKAKYIPSMPQEDVYDREALTSFIREHRLTVGDKIELEGNGQGEYGTYKVKEEDVPSGGRKRRTTKKQRKTRGRKTRGRKTKRHY
jgi:hypothetical protein